MELMDLWQAVIDGKASECPTMTGTRQYTVRIANTRNSYGTCAFVRKNLYLTYGRNSGEFLPQKPESQLQPGFDHML